MEHLTLSPFSEKLSRIALGTWAIGGSLWGGTDDKESIATLLRAFEKGINVIDTAPGYGTGKSEELVGRALQEANNREEIFISTKAGLEFPPDGSCVRNSTKEFLSKDLHNSLKRLGTDYIDIYYIHWPDPLVPISEAAATLLEFYKEGKIRAIGVSNFSIDQLDEFRSVAPCHFYQPPYNIFERYIEDDIMPYCKKNSISLMTYSALCRGLLSGKVDRKRTFSKDDLRSGMDAKFTQPALNEYIDAVDELKKLAKEKGHSVLELAVRWVLDKGSQIALWGARHPEQLDPTEGICDWHLNEVDMEKIEKILVQKVEHDPGPTIGGPPARAA